MIVVTGGSRGIGRAICLAALSIGCEVLAVASSENSLLELKAVADDNRQLHTLTADLSSAVGCQEVADWVGARNVKVDVLVNNVGAYTPAGLLDEQDQLPYLMELNLMAPHRLTRLLLHDELKHIVTIGSVAAWDLPAHMPAYTVSKYALHGWHFMLEKELKETSVNCSLIVPGATLTSAWENESQLPLHILQPQEVAALVIERMHSNEGKIVEIRPKS